LVLLEFDESGEPTAVAERARIVLARCSRCRSRVRVLPCDVLPCKTYGLAVIEDEVSDYSKGNLSLRQVAWRQLGDRTPAHSTLHGWTEGLGAHALGRPSGDLGGGGAPMSRFVAEAEPRVPAVRATLSSEISPDPRRHRSEPRRDRLIAVIRTMALARLIVGAVHPHAMAWCRRLMLSWSASSSFEFPSRIPCTAIEHRDRSESPRSRTSSPRSRDRCPTRTRSPPDASSTSHS
jgi:hypothetical protein